MDETEKVVPSAMLGLWWAMKTVNKTRFSFLASMAGSQLCLLAACTTPHYDIRSIPSEGSGLPPLVRLHDVAFPLLVAAADWCVVDQEPTYGFLIMQIQLPDWQAEADGGSRISVVYVHPQSPAASAGVMPGDQLIRINERTIAGMRSEEVWQLIRRMTGARIQPLQLDVLRDGREHTLHLWAVPACQFSVQLIESDRINGIADGNHIGVTTGTIRFVGSDDELAWVVAHEIAHNVLNHSQNARLRAMLHAFLSATTGASTEEPTAAPRRSLEARADYVGAYIMARAGYDLRAIKEFWRRLERLRSGQRSPEMDQTHPTTAERLAAFELTLKEIEEKRQPGESLQALPPETSLQTDR
jgi:Peptidase family M48/PDZ domain